jgi:hypothetical protein
VDGHVAGGQRLARPGRDQAVAGQAGLDRHRDGRRRHHHPHPVVPSQQVPQARPVEVVEVLVAGQHQLEPGQVAGPDRRREAPVRVVGQERVEGQAGARGPQQEAGLPDPGQLDAHAVRAPAIPGPVRDQR